MGSNFHPLCWSAVVSLGLLVPGSLAQSSAGSAASSPADPPAQASSSRSVLCAPTKATSRVEDVHVVGESQGANLNEYLDDSVLPLIRANWYRMASKSSEKAGGDAVVQFTIRRDGSVAEVNLTDGAGHAVLGNLALGAVKNSGQFGPLPAEFKGESVVVSGRFAYEPASGGMNLGTAKSSERIYTRLCSPDEGASGNFECVTPPHVTYQPDIEFSEQARKKGTQGTVIVLLIVGADGTVQSACASQPLGDGLDEKAVEAVRKYKFEPARLRGEPKPVQLWVEVDFHLDGNPDPVNDPSKDPTAAVGPMRSGITAKILPFAPSGEVFKPCDGKVAGCVLPPQMEPWPQLQSVVGEPEHKGKAILRLTITTDGKAENIQVVRSLGPGLDRKAVEAMSKQRFKPATKDGHPVAVEIEVEVDFRLYDDTAATNDPGKDPGAKDNRNERQSGAQTSARVVPVSASREAMSALENPCENKANDAPGGSRCVTVNGVAEPVYHVGNGVTAPRTTYNPPPEFSEEARKKKIEGVVVLSMIVTSEGNADQIKVTQGRGYGLDEKAMEAVRKWKFQPATKDGKPVSVEVAVEVAFHLMKGPR